MRVIDQLCDLHSDPMIVAVFSDAGHDRTPPNIGLAINDLLTGSTRITADRWVKSVGKIRNAAVVATKHPVPVDADFNYLEEPKDENGKITGSIDQSKIAGYVSKVHFKAT